MLSEVVHAIRERRLLVAGIVVLVVLAVFVAGILREPSYRAEAIVSVKPKNEPGGVPITEDLPKEVLNAVASEDLLREAVKEAGWTAGVADFKDRLDVEEFVDRGGRAGLRVRFTGLDAGGATRAANAYATLFVERAERFGKERFAGGTLAADAGLERKAETPPSGSGPRALLRAGIAACVGLLLGGAAALGLQGRSRGWDSIRDVELALKVPVLGTVPEYPLLEKDRP